MCEKPHHSTAPADLTHIALSIETWRAQAELSLCVYVMSACVAPSNVFITGTITPERQLRMRVLMYSKNIKYYNIA